MEWHVTFPVVTVERTNALLVVFFLALSGCGSELPADIVGYQERCTRMTAQAIEPYEEDPHLGHKHVYACDIDRALVEANTRPFPVGTIIVKESTRPGESAPWLVATARKREAGWHWDEYTRNFPDEPYRRIPVGQGKCTGCHVADDDKDPIFTSYTAP